MGNNYNYLSLNMMELVDNLQKMNSIKTCLLAKKIVKAYGTNKFDDKIYRKRLEVKEKLIDLFMDSVDKNTAYKLKSIHKSINTISMFLYNETKWNVTRYEAIHQLSEDMFDPIVHHLVRYDSGYEVVDIYSQNYGNMFISLYGIYLNRLHKLYTEEEAIMLGNYQIINPKMKYQTMKLIITVLGIKEPPKKEKYKMKKKITR